jgi:glycosyltransferase involved in cell wall biosynthesis
MKICHCTSVHSRYDVRIFLKECNELQRNGYQVHLIIADDKANEVIDGIHICSVKKEKIRLLRFLLTTGRIYKKAKLIKADVYHLHDPELLPMGWLLRLSGHKVVFDSHECYKTTMRDKFSFVLLRKIFSIFYAKIEKFFCKRMNGLVAATENIASVLRFYNSNVIVLHNYPLLREYPKILNKNSRTRNIFYSGDISKDRGILKLIKALEYLKDVHLILCGTFYDVDVKQTCTTLPGWNKVHYQGYCNRSQLQYLGASCCCGIVNLLPKANYVTACPNKFFEYMAMGLPIIASSFPLWQKIVENEGYPIGLCIDPCDPMFIAEAIKWILDNPNDAAEMGLNGRKAVEKKYNFEKERSFLCQLYNTL